MLRSHCRVIIANVLVIIHLLLFFLYIFTRNLHILFSCSSWLGCALVPYLITALLSCCNDLNKRSRIRYLSQRILLYLRDVREFWLIVKMQHMFVHVAIQYFCNIRNYRKVLEVRKSCRTPQLLPQSFIWMFTEKTNRVHWVIFQHDYSGLTGKFSMRLAVLTLLIALLLCSLNTDSRVK